jgi:hypothetical protein
LCGLESIVPTKEEDSANIENNGGQNSINPEGS